MTEQPDLLHIADMPLPLVRASLAECMASKRWTDHVQRQRHPGSAHHDTEALYLRWAPEWTVESIFNSTDAIDYPAASELLRTLTLVAHCCDQIRATEIGRIMVVSLKPGGRVDPHFDAGIYAAHFDRFHCVMQSDPGNQFKVGDTTAHMQEGELWQFNHRKQHEVWNLSGRARVHVIIDAVA